MNIKESELQEFLMSAIQPTRERQGQLSLWFNESEGFFTTPINVWKDNPDNIYLGDHNFYIEYDINCDCWGYEDNECECDCWKFWLDYRIEEIIYKIGI